MYGPNQPLPPGYGPYDAPPAYGGYPAPAVPPPAGYPVAYPPYGYPGYPSPMYDDIGGIRYLLYLVALFVPTLGIIIGLIMVIASGSPFRRAVGKNCILLGIVSIVLYAVLWGGGIGSIACCPLLLGGGFSVLGIAGTTRHAPPPRRP